MHEPCSGEVIILGVFHGARGALRRTSFATCAHSGMRLPRRSPLASFRALGRTSGAGCAFEGFVAAGKATLRPSPMDLANSER